MAELADAPDLGSGVHDVQVQVLLSALNHPLRTLCFQGFFFFGKKKGADHMIFMFFMRLFCSSFIRFVAWSIDLSCDPAVAKTVPAFDLYSPRFVQLSFERCRVFRQCLNRDCVQSVLMIIYGQGNQSRAAYPLIFSEGRTLQTKERRAMPMNVTYSDLFQVLLFIVALGSLCYQIFKGKK